MKGGGYLVVLRNSVKIALVLPMYGLLRVLLYFVSGYKFILLSLFFERVAYGILLEFVNRVLIWVRAGGGVVS